LPHFYSCVNSEAAVYWVLGDSKQVFSTEGSKEDERIVGEKTDLIFGCYWLCCWVWECLVLPHLAQTFGGCWLGNGQGSGRRERLNLKGGIRIF